MIIPDISFYQDDNGTPQGVDFAKMKTQTPAVIIRAGQNLWRDPDFAHNWKASKDAGLLRGSYFFYDSRVNPKRQAELYVDTLGNDLGEMELWMDFEDKYGGAYGKQQDWYDFAERIKSLVPNAKLGVYTGYYYWTERITSINAYFAQYPLWIAWYNLQKPLIPKPFQNWLYWQYSDNGDGSLYGVESKNIDLNYFNGSDEDFYKRYGTFPHPVQKVQLIATFGTAKVLYER